MNYVSPNPVPAGVLIVDPASSRVISKSGKRMSVTRVAVAIAARFPASRVRIYPLNHRHLTVLVSSVEITIIFLHRADHVLDGHVFVHWVS